MQSDPSQPQEQQPVVQGRLPAKTPSASPKKLNIKIVFLALLVSAVAGLGYWSFQANANLKAAKQSLAMTQSKYDALRARNEKLTSDLGQTNTELEQVDTELAKTNEILTATKSEVSKANSQVSSLKSKKEKAGPYVTVLFSVFFLPDNEAKELTIYVLISLMKDQELLELYSNFTESPNQSNFETWIGYALTTMGDILRK